MKKETFVKLVDTLVSVCKNRDKMNDELVAVIKKHRHCNEELSFRELQVMFGFTSPQAIYNWQNGISLPSVDNFIVLTAVLGTTIEEIIAIEGEDSDSDEETMICPQILS